MRANFQKYDLYSAPIARALPRYIVPFFKFFKTEKCFKTMLFPVSCVSQKPLAFQKHSLLLIQPKTHAKTLSERSEKCATVQVLTGTDSVARATYSIVYRGDVSVRKRSARHNTCCVCCFKTRSTRSTCRTQTTHASRAERAERAAQRSRGRLRSRLPARAKRVARVARHYCTRAHFWGAASSQFGYPAYAVVPQGSHWSHG